MGFAPQCAGGSSRFKSDFAPPSRLIAAAMQFPIVTAAERHREVIAVSAVASFGGRAGPV